MIKADEEGMRLIKQLEDAVLKGFGLAAVDLINQIEKQLTLIPSNAVNNEELKQNG